MQANRRRFLPIVTPEDCGILAVVTHAENFWPLAHVVAQFLHAALPVWSWYVVPALHWPHDDLDALPESRTPRFRHAAAVPEQKARTQLSIDDVTRIVQEEATPEEGGTAEEEEVVPAEEEAVVPVEEALPQPPVHIPVLAAAPPSITVA